MTAAVGPCGDGSIIVMRPHSRWRCSWLVHDSRHGDKAKGQGVRLQDRTASVALCGFIFLRALRAKPCGRQNRTASRPLSQVPTTSPTMTLSRWPDRDTIRRYTPRDVGCLLQQVGDNWFGARHVAEPVAVHLDPPKFEAGELRIGAGMAEPGFRIVRDRLNSSVVGLEQLPDRGRARRAPGCGAQITADDPEILGASGARDANRQPRLGRAARFHMLSAGGHGCLGVCQ
jgi:hypothetical protein